MIPLLPPYVSKMECKYNDELNILTVMFKSGNVYEYHSVTRDTYNCLAEAESVGKFLLDYVIGKHDYRRIE